ncbi:MAG: phosphate ABC transporter permease subunit PstC [Armatimonadetes bacterium]|nr:phosphate ABC transporter permease subunit PstC [Armatimonadota bacterium]
MTEPTQRTTFPAQGNRIKIADKLFGAATFFGAAFLMVVVLVIAYQLVTGSWAEVGKDGTAFFTGSDWNASAEKYGALPTIWGTLLTSLIAILFGGLTGVAISAYLVELAPKWLFKPVSFLVDLLAAIPSIIFGLWGREELVPYLRKGVYPELKSVFGWTGWFGTENSPIVGNGILTAGLVLGVMIIPTVAAVTREMLLVVPKTMRDGSLALGSNKTEALIKVQIPYAIGGILGGLILGLGRALGETMAVTMLIGNNPVLSKDLLGPGATLASLIATNFADATNNTRTALIGLGLVLFCFTLAINVLARYLVRRVRQRSGLSA